MAHSPEDDSVASEHLAASEENLIPQAATRGESNSKALKIAGLTTLVCLLVSSQIFACYMLFDQRQQLHGLKKTSDRLDRDMLRSSQVKTPMKFQMPMNSLLMDFNADKDAVATTPPQTKQQDTAVASMEKQLMDVMQDLDLPRFNESFLDNMQSLKHQMNETEWKSFETWMRYWLILQRSQEKPAPPPTQQDMPVIKTKCQTEATGGVGKFGSFKPQCDEQGRYHPMQCWHATGYCWCVDETGTAIKDTVSRARPQCGEL